MGQGARRHSNEAKNMKRHVFAWPELLRWNKTTRDREVTVLIEEEGTHQQILGQKRGYNHPASIMHPSCVCHLTHGGVDDWIACFTLFPGLEVFHVVRPFDIAVFWFEWFTHARWSEISDGNGNRKVDRCRFGYNRQGGGRSRR